MKTYIGKKEVKASPMTKGDAFHANLLRQNTLSEAESNEPGYFVEYADGYMSWSPANVFEAAYKVANTALDRVNIEADELLYRTSKLGEFIFNQNDGKDFQAMKLGTRAFLVAQLNMMGAYLTLLKLRQESMEKGADCHPNGLSFEQILPLIKEGFAVRRNGWNGKGLMVFKQVPAHITSNIIPKMQSLPDEAKRLIMGAKGYIDYTCQCLIYNPETGRADSWVPSVADIFANDWELVE